MRPWQHAKSSSGENWKQDLSVHELIDSSKALCPDLRHRIILHNCDFGLEIVNRAFPDNKRNSEIVTRHIREDLDCEPSLEEWLNCCRVQAFPQIPYRRARSPREEAVEEVTKKFKIEDRIAISEILEFLDLPTTFAGADAAPILFNTFGITLVKQIFGGPRVLSRSAGDYGIFEPAHAAEALIYWFYGRIPTLQEIVAAVNSDPGKNHD